MAKLFSGCKCKTKRRPYTTWTRWRDVDYRVDCEERWRFCNWNEIPGSLGVWLAKHGYLGPWTCMTCQVTMNLTECVSISYWVEVSMTCKPPSCTVPAPMNVFIGTGPETCQPGKTKKWSYTRYRFHDAGTGKWDIYGQYGDIEAAVGAKSTRVRNVTLMPGTTPPPQDTWLEDIE